MESFKYLVNKVNNVVNMVDVVVGGKVNPEVKARLIKEAGANGKTVNEVIKDLVNDYLDEKDKIAHPTEYTPTEEVETVEIVPPSGELEDDEEMSEEEFFGEMWDSFVECAKERGYTLVKTKTLKKVVSVLKARKKAKAEETEYVCPECGYTGDKKFKYCPKCGKGLIEWED